MIRYTKAYIKNLLDKYMDGTSTLEEEDILAEYFRGKDIPQRSCSRGRCALSLNSLGAL